MAKLTSAASLAREEVQIDVSLRNIDLTKTATLSDDGVSLQALYSYLKSVWRQTDFTAGVTSASSLTITLDAGDAKILPGMKVRILSGPGTIGGSATGEGTVDTISGTSLVLLAGGETASMDATTVLTVINHLIEYPFPLVAITPEQFEFQFDWTMTDATAKKLLRDAGWQELASGAVDGPKYTGIISLGTIDTVTGVSVTGTPASGQAVLPVSDASSLTVGMEVRVVSGTGVLAPNTKILSIAGNNVTLDTNISTTFDNAETMLFGDRVYYAFYNTATETWTTPVDFDFLGTVNEPILTDNGVDDPGDFTNQVLTLFIRTEGKTYGKSSSVDIGIPDIGGTGAGNINFQVYRFPLSESADLNYYDADGSTPVETDVAIQAADAAGEKYDAVTVATTLIDTSSGTTIDVASGLGASVKVGSFVYDEQGLIPPNTQVVSIATDAITISNALTSNTIVTGDDVRFCNGPHIIFHATDQSSADYFVTDLKAPGAASSYGVTINARDGSSGNPGTSLSLKELYVWTQYQLRQAGSIDFDADIEGGNVGVQNGKTSDNMLTFVGADLQSVNLLTPSSAAWGAGNLDRATVTDGSGVMYYNFASSVIGNVKLRDNSGVLHAFPVISSGKISFGGTGSTMLTDTNSSFTMFMTYSRQYSVADMAMTSSSGQTGTLTGSATLPLTTAGDYIDVSGFPEVGNNGVYLVGGTPTTSAIDVTRIDDVTLADESVTGTTDNFRFNPVNSPDAIIVLQTDLTEIQGNIASGTGTPTLTVESAGKVFEWDFAYDQNTQPNESAAENRVGGTDVPVTIRAVGQDKAQWTEVTGTITSASGQEFQVIAPLERNYAA